MSTATTYPYTEFGMNIGAFSDANMREFPSASNLPATLNTGMKMFPSITSPATLNTGMKVLPLNTNTTMNQPLTNNYYRLPTLNGNSASPLGINTSTTNPDYFGTFQSMANNTSFPTTVGYNNNNPTSLDYNKYIQEAMVNNLNAQRAQSEAQAALLKEQIENSDKFGWSDFSNILGGIGSIGSAYAGLKALGIEKKKFDEAKALLRANYTNQAELINQQLRDGAERRAAYGIEPNAQPLQLRTTY